VRDIGIDVDDVLKPWSERAHAAVVLAGRDNGKTITCWNMHEDYGITSDELWEIVFAAYMDGMLLQPPYANVQRDLTDLMACGFNVHLITARGFEDGIAEVVREQTREWVSMYGIPHDTLTFTKDKAAMGMDYFLDDGIHNVTALRAAGCEAYLRDQCHNQNSDLPRVADLAEFVELVLAEALVCK
jgi:5'(3')-deoxyribonucleotidase